MIFLHYFGSVRRTEKDGIPTQMFITAEMLTFSSINSLLSFIILVTRAAVPRGRYAANEH